MINIGFITSPITSGHAPRGVGFYTQNLLHNLKIQAPGQGINIQEINSPADLGLHKLNLLHYPFFDLFFPSLPIFKSIPTVVTIHDVVPLRYPTHYPPGLLGSLSFFRQKIALRTVKRVITDSMASVADLQHYLSLPPEQIKLVYLAVPDTYRPVADRTLLHSLRLKYKLPPKFVLYVGDINWNKNLPMLVTACLRFQLPLVLVGKNITLMETLDLTHPELVHLKALLPRLSSPLIFRLGFIPEEDKIALYSLASLYCQPSLAEGFGLPVLEAMACGCPVICSSASSLPEIAGDAAVYFDPLDQSSLESAITHCLTDPALCKRMVAAGLARAGKFTWTKATLNTISVYKEAV